ncbi:hypothetical protein HT105_22530, partial [Bacteroides fragilis]|nr:hypothetical protein [Bacteroides fragilis]
MAAATALGSAGLTAVVLHYFPKLGFGVVIVLGLLQLAAVGWFWKSATAATAVAGVWKTVMGLSLLAGVVVLTAAAEIVFMILATGVDGMGCGAG